MSCQVSAGFSGVRCSAVAVASAFCLKIALPCISPGTATAVESINCSIRRCQLSGVRLLPAVPASRPADTARPMPRVLSQLLFFLQPESDRPNSELQTHLQLHGQTRIVVRQPDMQVAGALIENVVEQEDFVTDGLPHAHCRRQLFAPLRLDLHLHELFPVTDRNLRRLPRLKMQRTQHQQPADHIVNTRGYLHIVRIGGVFVQIFFEINRLARLGIVGDPGFLVAVTFVRRQKRVLRA